MLNPRQQTILNNALKYVSHEYEPELKRIIQDNMLFYWLEFEALDLSCDAEINDIIKMNFSENDLKKTKTNIQDSELVKALHLAFIEYRKQDRIDDYQAANAIKYCNDHRYKGYLIDVKKALGKK